MYVEININPSNGTDIKDTACGVSDIMIRLKIVKGVQEYGNNGVGYDLIHDKNEIFNLEKI